MDAQDHPIEHFEEMKRLAIRLKALPAQVLDHSYSSESFGSWTVTLRCRGRALRLSFDGRDKAYVLEDSPSRKPPHAWREIRRLDAGEAADACAPPILEAIRSAGLGD